MGMLLLFLVLSLLRYGTVFETFFTYAKTLWHSVSSLVLIYLTFIVFGVFSALLLNTVNPFEKRFEFGLFFIMYFSSMGMQQSSNKLVIRYDLSAAQLSIFIFTLALNLFVIAVLPGAIILESKRTV